MKKVILFGVVLFVLQLVGVYFVMTKFVAPHAAEPHSAPAEAAHGEIADAGGDNIYIVKDVIVNPAGTNGTRFLLTTVGFEVTTDDGRKELEKKDVQVRDALNGILTTKELRDLVDIAQRESIRVEIAEKVGQMLKTGQLRTVYFSKFIIQ
jgi:flagellar protein FliL